MLSEYRTDCSSLGVLLDTEVEEVYEFFTPEN